MSKKTKERVIEKVDISNSIFAGVYWDAKALQGLNDVARALLNITELYKSQNIRVDTLLHLGNGPKSKMEE